MGESSYPLPQPHSHVIRGISCGPDSQGLGHLQTALTNLLAEVKTSSQQIISFCVSYYFKISGLFLWGH